MCACACDEIKYEDDITFIPSAVANSPEFTLYINDKICKDMDDQVGFCAKRIRQDRDLRLAVPARPYAYTLVLDCSNNIQDNEVRYDVPINKPFYYTIYHNIFDNVRVFNCTIDIFPIDRDEPIAAFAAFRAVVIDKQYVSLNLPHRVDPEITVPGKYAYLTRVYEKNGSHDYKKEPVIETKSDKLWVESYNMRFSYQGFEK